VAVPSGLSFYLILPTFKHWKTYISRATVAGRRTSGALEVQMMMMTMMTGGPNKLFQHAPAFQ